MGSRGMVGRIYKEDHYTLLHTKCENSAPCGFGEEYFFYVFPIVCLWELLTPGARPFLVGRIYKEDHYTLLHTKYESSVLCGIGVEDFFCFSHDTPGPGPYGPQGHSWQDLYRGPLYIATHKI